MGDSWPIGAARPPHLLRGARARPRARRPAPPEVGGAPGPRTRAGLIIGAGANLAVDRHGPNIDAGRRWRGPSICAHAPGRARAQTACGPAPRPAAARPRARLSLRNEAGGARAPTGQRL